MSLSSFQKNMHLLWRTGFGPSLETLPEISTRTPLQLWHRIREASRQQPEKIMATQPLRTREELQMSVVSDSARIAIARAITKKESQEMRRFTLVWLMEMIASKSQLRERMALFWHGHFAAWVARADFNCELLQIFREQGLGKFGDLLLAVSKSSAMLTYLNNHQNRKAHPNENFAREVMELFTMGRGYYTEQDVKEGARAFTGWTYLAVPDTTDTPMAGAAYFQFSEKTHDDGPKTFLGATGNFKGEDIIRILLEQKQTARFITAKIYACFVNEKGNEQCVAQLSETFFQSGYDLMTLLEEIFTAPWFFDEANAGNRIKAPTELLVGIGRMMPYKIGDAQGLGTLQSMLGQVLFQPPNVAGWPMGTAWIDSSSLLLRMQMPYILAGPDTLKVMPQQNAPANPTGQSLNFESRLLKSQAEWESVDKILVGMTLAQLAACLLVCPKKAPLSIVQAAVENYDPTPRLRHSLLRIMSLPEYQLC